MPTSFFPSTVAFRRQHRELYQFAWPTMGALWNLRWQLRGYLDVRPEAGPLELANRFLAGSGIESRSDLREVLDVDWGIHHQRFAGLLLTSTIAMYEGWAEDTASWFSSDQRRAVPLQYPTMGTPTSDPARSYNKPGVRDVISQWTTNPSPRLITAFEPRLKSSAHYTWAELDALLLCYRHFKELRNAMMHRDGMANETGQQASEDYATLTDSSLGMLVPRYVAMKENQRVSLDVYGVVGFSKVVQRIVTTVEGRLAEARQAEAAFAKRWQDRYRFQMYSSVPSERARRLNSCLLGLGLPAVANPLDLFELLRSHRVLV